MGEDEPIPLAEQRRRRHAENERRRRIKNLEKARARNRDWRKNNLEKARTSERESARRRRAKNPDTVRAYDRRLKRRKRLEQFGLTTETWQELLDRQGNACAICKKTGCKWHLDHCPSTGKARGILCGNCNTALGLFKDNIKALAAAIEYLEGVR